MSKIAELINLADRELYICTPMVKEIRMEMKKNIEEELRLLLYFPILSLVVMWIKPLMGHWHIL